MPRKNVQPELIIPRQETISQLSDEVHMFMDERRTALAHIAIRKLLSIANDIDYAAIGKADAETYNRAKELEAEHDFLIAERIGLEQWVRRQDGANLAHNPKLLQRLIDTQKRIDIINTRAIPRLDEQIDAYQPTLDETESIAEITGKAWPYYPELSPGKRGAQMLPPETTPETMLSDAPLRASIHNDISRLSYDRRGKGLGIKYSTLTALWFNDDDADKSALAKTVAAMMRDGEVRVWQDGSERYIESLLPAYSTPNMAEKEGRRISLHISLEDELAEPFVQAVIQKYGQSGYRRIDYTDALVIQIPLAFANAYALEHKLILSKLGPTEYRFQSTVT